VKLTRELVRRFELHQAEAVESLIALSLTVPGNPEGYALFREGGLRAMLSTNPRAKWVIQSYGLTGEPAAAARRVVEFFNSHGVPACARIVPDGFTQDQADTLGGLGLRHTGFHTILWAPLPLAIEPAGPADIREVSTLAEMDARIDIDLGVYGVPPQVIDRLRPLRRTWLGSADRRQYLAYVDGRPAAEASLFWRDDIAYLESAGTLTAYRGRGLQHALVRRRIRDAMELGCRVIIGGADYENVSRTNQMACGLSVAYTAALWTQRPETMLPRT